MVLLSGWLHCGFGCVGGVLSGWLAVRVAGLKDGGDKC